MDRPASQRFPLPQLAILLVALAFAFVTSYYSWTNNTHEARLRRVHPDWFTGRYVIFDGYGQYAGQIKYFFEHPDATAGFRKFIHGFVHSNTPLFPFLAALLSLTGVSILWSCFAVTIVSSLATLLLFYALLRQRDPAMGPGAIACFYSFLFHPSMLSGWSRPLPDMTAMALLLAFFWCIREFEKTHRARLLAAAALLCAIGMASKTVMYLLLPLIFIMLCVHVVRAWRRAHWHVHPAVMVCALILVAAPVILILAHPDSASAKFLFRALRSPFVNFPRAKHIPGILAAAALFFAVSFNGCAIVMAYGWKRSFFRREFEHVLWIGLYVLQRLVFFGFSGVFARARYGIPLAASLLILALPGFQKLWSNPRTRPLTYLPAAINLVVWLIFLLRL